ncbi:hypothetical protein FQR65_LT18624 [Abscondita terminalis]|nr:hypothetical protein FQR65_LT18624 [Abscondita terminalis]
MLKKDKLSISSVVRTKKAVRRKDGSYISFEDNACVCTNAAGEIERFDKVEKLVVTASFSVKKDLAKRKGTNPEISALFGKDLLKKAVAAGIGSVVFDRNGFVYHGRVKALADGAREGSTHNSKRIGRGQGSGKGGTATKGHKGQKARAGYSQKIGFEGGQMPLQRRLPEISVSKTLTEKSSKVSTWILSNCLSHTKGITGGYH